MPENIVCPTCGREYPWQVPREYCQSCKTEFTRGTCYVCRTYREDLRHGKCKDCCRDISRQCIARKRADSNNNYAGWVKKINSVPAPIHTLTEDEWLEACRYFGGCALCSKPQIETRLMYVPAHRGGKYTMYNMVPACEDCATSYKQTVKARGNPFTRVYNCNDYKDSVARLKKVMTYLEGKYDEYIKNYSV